MSLKAFKKGQEQTFMAKMAISQLSKEKSQFSSLTSNSFGLFKDHLLRDASFSLIQLLPNAGNDTKALSKSMSHLLANQLGMEEK